ncbi:MAG: tetratricopeptide repeat protein, partial [Chitinivibrionales bacterium]|nr:tetratricopeptide repeat protein [Chitinivibrionales bacterium]
RMYRRILREFPDQVPESAAHLKIGFCLVQASRFEEAIKHFEEANRNPASEEKPEILYWLGLCYAKTGEYQKALTEFLKVPYLYSGEGKWGVTAELEAARIYERRGEYERAKSLYRKIVRSDGETGQFGRAANKRLKQLSNLVLESP